MVARIAVATVLAIGILTVPRVSCSSTLVERATPAPTGHELTWPDSTLWTRAPQRLTPDVTVTDAVSGIVIEHDDGEEEFRQTSAVPHVEGQVYGWVVSLHTDRDSVRVREEIVLPRAPATWGGDVGTISHDRRRAVRERTSKVYGHMIYHDWSIARGDPKGLYEIRVYVEGSFVGQFTFLVGADR